MKISGLLCAVLVSVTSALWLSACATNNAPSPEYKEAMSLYDQQDYEKALPLFEKAAANGEASAQNNLGTLYRSGHGVTKDYAQARKWFEKAAAQGNSSAQMNLAFMYYKGEGVTADIVEAYKWLLIADAGGNESAREKIKLLAGKMTPEQIAEAEKRAK